MRGEARASDASGKQCCAPDDLERHIAKAPMQLSLQPCEVVVLIREDPLLVVDIHHSLCQPSARHSVVKERGSEKHRARIHERRKMIEGYGLRIDRAWKTVEEVAHAHGVEPRAVDGDRLQAFRRYVCGLYLKMRRAVKSSEF